MKSPAAGADRQDAEVAPLAGGAWIEISRTPAYGTSRCRRPPRGGRGLKYYLTCLSRQTRPSPPSRGAWIEMVCWNISGNRRLMSPPSRGAWIEIKSTWICEIDKCGRPPRGGRGLKLGEAAGAAGRHCPSPPSRGAWIEIPRAAWPWWRGAVAPPRGGRGLK